MSILTAAGNIGCFDNNAGGLTRSRKIGLIERVCHIESCDSKSECGTGFVEPENLDRPRLRFVRDSVVLEPHNIFQAPKIRVQITRAPVLAKLLIGSVNILGYRNNQQQIWFVSFCKGYFHHREMRNKRTLSVI